MSDRCSYGTMDWYCVLRAGHDGPHESMDLSDRAAPACGDATERLAEIMDEVKAIGAQTDALAAEFGIDLDATERDATLQLLAALASFVETDDTRGRGFIGTAAEDAARLRTLAAELRTSRSSSEPTEGQRFAAQGWDFSSIEDASRELDRLSGIVRAQSVLLLKAGLEPLGESAASSPGTEDTARLDWLEAAVLGDEYDEGYLASLLNYFSFDGEHFRSLREAIDAGIDAARAPQTPPGPEIA